ncbi:hypothetical protein G7Y89_g3004 [Cudoniella acicularis]|uniref:Uncharacterized protein n=1 Tax=Cudoniella acicularis TaxID=354080 RepID=A0A8H4W5Z9_9HELO|nr:hypothetical protein G7Y89_g3004 [Cudoniella acicularis]
MVQATINDEEDDESATTFILVLGRSQRQRGKFERLGMLTPLAKDSEATLFDNAIHTTVTIELLSADEACGTSHQPKHSSENLQIFGCTITYPILKLKEEILLIPGLVILHLVKPILGLGAIPLLPEPPHTIRISITYNVRLVVTTVEQAVCISIRRAIDLVIRGKRPLLRRDRAMSSYKERRQTMGGKGNDPCENSKTGAKV